MTLLGAKPGRVSCQCSTRFPRALQTDLLSNGVDAILQYMARMAVGCSSGVPDRHCWKLDAISEKHVCGDASIELTTDEIAPSLEGGGRPFGAERIRIGQLCGVDVHDRG